GIRCHRLANIRMRREERAECRMLLRIGVIVDQRGRVGELVRDLRMLAREVIPELELICVDIASIGGFELSSCISVDDHTQRLSFLSDRRSNENDRKRNCEQQNRYA